jgi:hypothetical protein
LLGPWQDRHDFIYSALTSKVTETRRKFRYGFFDVQDLKSEEGIYAFGRMVKYKPVLEGEIVDEERREIVEGGLPLGVVAKPEFLLHYESSLVAYRPISNRLSHRQFRLVYAALIEAAHRDFFVSADLQPVVEQYKLLEAVFRFSRIDRISFEIRPTNPSNRDIYRHIDRRLKALNAAKIKETIISEQGGINQRELKDDDAFRSLLMASDGYGFGEVEGEIEGHKATIATEDTPVQEEIIATDDPGGLLDQLRASFRRIMSRDGQ